MPAAAAPVPVPMTREWLVERFGTQEAPGWSTPTSGDDEEETFERTGTPTAMCWAWAREVVADLGDDRATMSGYFCDESGTSTMSKHAEGHDLAIVDGRFLVDGWVAHVAGIGPCVLDLADINDLRTARRLHDDFALWTRRPVVLDGMEKDQTPEASTNKMKEAA